MEFNISFNSKRNLSKEEIQAAMNKIAGELGLSRDDFNITMGRPKNIPVAVRITDILWEYKASEIIMQMMLDEDTKDAAIKLLQKYGYGDLATGGTAEIGLALFNSSVPAKFIQRQILGLPNDVTVYQDEFSHFNRIYRRPEDKDWGIDEVRDYLNDKYRHTYSCCTLKNLHQSVIISVKSWDWNDANDIEKKLGCVRRYDGYFYHELNHVLSLATYTECHTESMNDTQLANFIKELIDEHKVTPKEVFCLPSLHLPKQVEYCKPYHQEDQSVAISDEALEKHIIDIFGFRPVDYETNEDALTWYHVGEEQETSDPALDAFIGFEER